MARERDPWGDPADDVADDVPDFMRDDRVHEDDGGRGHHDLSQRERNFRRARLARAFAFTSPDAARPEFRTEAALVAFRLGAAARCAADRAGGPPPSGGARNQAVKFAHQADVATREICGEDLGGGSSACDELVAAWESGYSPACELKPAILCDHYIRPDEIETYQAGRPLPLTGPYEIPRPHKVGAGAACWYSPETQERLRLHFRVAHEHNAWGEEALAPLIRAAEARHPLHQAWQLADEKTLSVLRPKQRNIAEETSPRGRLRALEKLRALAGERHVSPSEMAAVGLFAGDYDDDNPGDALRDAIVTLKADIASDDKRAAAARAAARKGRPTGKREGPTKKEVAARKRTEKAARLAEANAAKEAERAAAEALKVARARVRSIKAPTKQAAKTGRSK